MTYRLLILIVLIVTTPVASAKVGGAWPDPVFNEVIPYGVSGLTHGPVLGAPTSTHMRIWIRAKQSMPFRVLYFVVCPEELGSLLRYEIANKKTRNKLR